MTSEASPEAAFVSPEEFERMRGEARELLAALTGVLDQAADRLDFGDPAEVTQVAGVLRQLARRFEVSAQRVSGMPEDRGVLGGGQGAGEPVSLVPCSRGAAEPSTDGEGSA